MKATILLTSLVLSPAVWAESMFGRDDSGRAVVRVDELESLKDKDAVIQSRLAQAAQKLDKIRTDLAPRYGDIFEAAQKEFAQLRNEANLDKYVPMVWQDNSLQKYVLRTWNGFQAEKPDFSDKQNSLLTDVAGLVDRVRFKHLQGINEKHAQMLLKKMQEAYDVYVVASYIEFSISDAKNDGIPRMWLIDAQKKAKRIGYSLPPGLIQDIEVVGARTYTYWKISTLVRDHNNKRTLSYYSEDLETIRSHSRIGGLDVSSALAKIQNCVKKDILCEVQASDITDAGVKMRAATEKINSVFENLPQNAF